MTEVHASVSEVRRIRRSFKKVSLCQQANIANELYIRASFLQGLSEKQAMAKLRRNLKCLYEIFNDPQLKALGEIRRA